MEIKWKLDGKNKMGEKKILCMIDNEEKNKEKIEFSKLLFQLISKKLTQGHYSNDFKFSASE